MGQGTSKKKCLEMCCFRLSVLYCLLSFFLVLLPAFKANPASIFQRKTSDTFHNKVLNPNIELSAPSKLSASCRSWQLRSWQLHPLWELMQVFPKPMHKEIRIQLNQLESLSPWRVSSRGFPLTSCGNSQGCYERGRADMSISVSKD